MKHDQREGPSSPLGLADVYYVLFRHKWLILGIAAAGIISVQVWYKNQPRLYKSEAKLLVRYVVKPTPLKSVGEDAQVVSPGENVILSEIEILKSMDLALTVVTNLQYLGITPKDIFEPGEELAWQSYPTNAGPSGNATGTNGNGSATNGGRPVISHPGLENATLREILQAAATIQRGITVDNPQESAILRVVFQHSKAYLVKEVLPELIQAYLKKSAALHLPNAEDFTTRRGTLDQELLNDRNQLRTKLRELSDKVGSMSLEDAKKLNTQEIAALNEMKRTVESQLAEKGKLAGLLSGTNASLTTSNLAGSTLLVTNATAGPLTSPLLSALTNFLANSSNQTQAAVADLSRTNVNGTNIAVSTNTLPADKVKEYKAVIARLERLHKTEADRLEIYTEENPMVKSIRDLIEEKEKQKDLLEAKYPDLAKIQVQTARAGGSPSEMALEAARIQGLIEQRNYVQQRLLEAQTNEQEIALLEPAIVDLQKRVETDQKKIESFSLTYNEEATKAAAKSSINVAQEPTLLAPAEDAKLKKIRNGVAAGSLAAGLAIAFLIELVLNHSVRSPGEVETRLHLPLFLTIPDTRRKGRWPFPFRSRNGGGRVRIAPAADDTGGQVAGNSLELAPWEGTHKLEVFYSALRDRLITFFDLKDLVHKPKLIAVTGCAKGVGVSTVAAGLAASLSETGDGNVLLVDMNLGQGAAQLFTKGKPACAITDALESEKRDTALVQDKLYVVTDRGNGDSLPQVLPKRFNHLVPLLKASDYDYIIFDMPAINQISVTPRLARFMDMVLLVIESGKSEREAVKRASSLLAESKANVAAVLNKNRTYVPRWLHRDALIES
jgi:Mrp family chromosome partitioning ATPase/uncharacterized protein involved in exopolysaccharide biosynthesis